MRRSTNSKRGGFAKKGTETAHSRRSRELRTRLILEGVGLRIVHDREREKTHRTNKDEENINQNMRYGTYYKMNEHM